MNRKQITEERKVAVQTAFDSRSNLHWTVREDANLQRELNREGQAPDQLTSGLVNRVVDCIKDL